MDGSLGTTNTLLGIIAAMSVLEALVIIGGGAAAFLVYRRVMRLVGRFEAEQVAPMMNRVDAILDDVRSTTHKVKEDTEHVDQAIRVAVVRAGRTVDRLCGTVRAKSRRLVAFIVGVRRAVEEILNDARHRPPTKA